MRTISFIPVIKKFKLTDNLKNYSSSDFEKLIIDKMTEQAIENINHKDYNSNLKLLIIKNILKKN